MPLTLSPAARTSVTYTTPASTSPSSTLVSVALTSASSVTGVTVRPAAAKTLAATAPHGTAGWQTATLTSALARSARVVTFAGLPGGTAISRTFVANVDGVSAARAATTASMFLSDADAKTSAGAPSMICVARLELGPKLKVILASGCAASNCLPSVVNDSVRD